VEPERTPSICGTIRFKSASNIHSCFCARSPRSQPSRDRVNLLYYIASRMACFRDVSFKGQAHEFSAFAHRRHRLKLRCQLNTFIKNFVMLFEANRDDAARR
jgi:hypothetical protein